MSSVNVTKASGEKQQYDTSKLRKSLASAGAQKEVIHEISKSVEEMLYEVIHTQKIYREAFKQLKSASQKSAVSYN